MAKTSHKSEATEETKDEILVADSATKEIYFYKDTKKGINQKSREVFKKEDKEIHYPIGYNGGAKYSKVDRFIYVGFNGRLPVGVSKSASRGLGFTKILKPLILFLESKREKLKRSKM